jgi:membrane carboxypeptidase/penicillin-binding protein
MGRRYFTGGAAASRYYFNKSASNLTPPKPPIFGNDSKPAHVFNPKKNPKRVVRRQRVSSAE